MIRINHLQKYFNRGKQNEIHVINDISLELPDRGMVAIFGRSGCGKTTLLNVLGGLDGYSSGEVTVNNERLKDNLDYLRNASIGYIFQNYNLHKDLTNYENVAVALRLCGMTDETEIEKRVMAALRAVDMERYRYRTPDTLSGGQQQRVAIARAIVKNPAVILADEPTGNLDEANTLMIMDLLHKFAKNHLVVLVTHEANLVDHYCDRVIELSDGVVTGERTNAEANGMVARNKNVIYLGEYEKTEGAAANVNVAYYGDEPETPIQLRVIKREGVTYLQVETPGVRVLDASSEIKLQEGVFHEGKTAQDAENEAKSGELDLSALPAIQGSDWGKLFRFGYSIKSGLRTVFGKKKKGKALLYVCMALFSVVLVAMTAVLGTSLRTVVETDDSLSRQIVYARLPDVETYEKLAKGIGNPDAAIDAVVFLKNGRSSLRGIEVQAGYFETAKSGMYSSGNSKISEESIYLEAGLLKNASAVCGRIDNIGAGEAVLSLRTAKKICEDSAVGYIAEPEALIGLTMTAGGSTFKIIGVADTDEPAVYMTALTLARIVARQRSLYIAPASDFNMTVASGTVVQILSTGESKETGASDWITGKEYQISDYIVTYRSGDYYEWMKEQHPDDAAAYDFDAFARGKAEADAKTAGAEDAESYYYEHYYEYLQKYVFGWMETYFSRLQEFYQIMLMTQNHVDEIVWIAANKNCYALMLVNEYGNPPVDLAWYYDAWLYKEKNGEFPAYDPDQYNTSTERLFEDYKQQYNLYYDEFYAWYYGDTGSYGKYSNARYILSDEDFIAATARAGKSSTLAAGYFSYEEKEVTDKNEKQYYNGLAEDTYLLLHTTDVDATEAWIQANVGEIASTQQYEGLLTPNDGKEILLKDNMAEILTSLITMAVILGVLCLCMYFIMRSALMSRVREVGIWRAIGVSKKNMLYRFFVESLVVTTVTVAISFLAVSGVMFMMAESNSLFKTLLYYPTWLAGILLVVLYAVCLISGTAPIASLLARSPSQIIAKYDI